MDNIRACIETLFLQINSSTILSQYFKCQPHLETLGINEEMFCQKFMVENKCYTLDQVHELYHLIQSEWMKYPLAHLRHQHKGYSLFYILLHYTKNMLVERDCMPVCRYKELLRWRMLAYKLGEDLLTTSFLAFQDILSRRQRDTFYWPPVITQDNPSINYLLKKGVTDLHFHLRGSSLNYELNWIALMNNIRNRKATFNKLKKCLSYRTSTIDKERWDSFYLSTLKACAIRYHLFLLVTAPNKVKTPIYKPIYEYLFCDNDILMQNLLQQSINSVRHYSPDCLDYAISIPPPNSYPSEAEKLLSGERKILYTMFHRIYSDMASNEEQILFYVYLLQKEQLRKELIQLNEREGFGNFSDYEKRKEIFIENYPKYQQLVPRLAIDTAFASGHLKYLECRITPKKNSNEIRQTIELLEKQIGRIKNRKTDYYYILHFIKKQDPADEKLKSYLKGYTQYRHFKLRHEIRQQGTATLEALRRYPKLKERIIGIDAANSELYCRPEVFGPVYRYMKHFDCSFSSNTHSLKYTYHVGEDFWDITDGLRAIDEAVLFLNLGANDRLGHALALGTNVKGYYKLRNNRVVMSKQNVLDNVMWLIYKSKELGIPVSTNLTLELQKTFHTYYDEIFLNLIQEENYEWHIMNKEENGHDRKKDMLIQGKDMNVYYLSWLVRGDDPETFFKPKPQLKTLWEITALNQYDDNIIQARKHRVARSLYHHYHYNAKVRTVGNEKCEIKITPEMISLIEQVQYGMCLQIAKLHLGIEANITSNQFIGSINKYIQHPIVKLYQLGLSTQEKESPQLSVSVNTDDRGIFDTSIEEEYALLALALEKEKDENDNPRYQPRYIYEWLDNIREMGFEQQFKKKHANKY